MAADVNYRVETSDHERLFFSSIIETEAGAISLAGIKNLMPTWADIQRCTGAMLRSTGVGFFLGLLPGPMLFKNNPQFVWAVIASMYIGLIGYFMRKLGFPIAPLVLASVLAQMLETSLQQALLISQESPFVRTAGHSVLFEGLDRDRLAT
jgi:TctA family transporter